jgi:hypothetical protein
MFGQPSDLQDEPADTRGTSLTGIFRLRPRTHRPRPNLARSRPLSGIGKGKWPRMVPYVGDCVEAHAKAAPNTQNAPTIAIRTRMLAMDMAVLQNLMQKTMIAYARLGNSGILRNWSNRGFGFMFIDSIGIGWTPSRRRSLCSSFGWKSEGSKS